MNHRRRQRLERPALKGGAHVAAEAIRGRNARGGLERGDIGSGCCWRHRALAPGPVTPQYYSVYFSRKTPSAGSLMAAIDTHAHAFTLDAEWARERRYTPDQAAPIADYLAQLDGAGVAQGVLVQPSFLGTDNRYLVQCLAAWPDRLRGIVVVDPSCDEATMTAMSAGHVVGLRLNV